MMKNIALSEDDLVGPLREALVVAAVAGMSGALQARTRTTWPPWPPRPWPSGS
jgi:hypothetical protein